MVGVVLIYQKTDKLKKLSFIWWPAIDAFRNDLTATPAFILTRLNVNPVAVFTNSINNYIRLARLSVLAPFAISKPSRAA